MSDHAAALGSAHWPSRPSPVRPGTSRPARALLLTALVAALVIGTITAGQFTARFSYPFLDVGPLHPPDILYLPSYFPPGSWPLGMDLGPIGTVGVNYEMRVALATGGQLLIWESTRANATVEDAVGRYRDETDVRGALTLWRSGLALRYGAPILHARVGQTLVVSRGALSTEELLRVADSLRRASPSSLLP